MVLRHFLAEKVLESQSRQGNYVKALKMAKTLDNKGFIPFRRKILSLSIFDPIFCCYACVSPGSRVQMALRLSGIVIKKQDKLVVFNKIYRTIFDRDWVQEQLVNIESDRENDRENTTIFNISICPYMGLQAFRQQDAKFFFGRQKLTREILARLQNSSFLAVVGASGSGKSSVVQAGVLPRLAAGEYPPGEYWCGCFPPGATPMNALAQVLTSDGKVDDVERSLHLGAEWFVWWLRCREESMVVWVVDQFEELFTSTGEKNWTDDKKRLEFLDLLLGALQEASDKLKLIITLWDDFIDLSKLKNGNQILTSTQILRK